MSAPPTPRLSAPNGNRLWAWHLRPISSVSGVCPDSVRRTLFRRLVRTGRPFLSLVAGVKNRPPHIGTMRKPTAHGAVVFHSLSQKRGRSVKDAKGVSCITGVGGVSGIGVSAPCRGVRMGGAVSRSRERRGRSSGWGVGVMPGGPHWGCGIAKPRAAGSFVRFTSARRRHRARGRIAGGTAERTGHRGRAVGRGCPARPPGPGPSPQSGRS